MLLGQFCVAGAILPSLGNSNQMRKVDLHKHNPEQRLTSRISNKVTECYMSFQKTRMQIQVNQGVSFHLFTLIFL